MQIKENRSKNHSTNLQIGNDITSVGAKVGLTALYENGKRPLAACGLGMHLALSNGHYGISNLFWCTHLVELATVNDVKGS